MIYTISFSQQIQEQKSINIAPLASSVNLYPRDYPSLWFLMERALSQSPSASELINNRELKPTNIIETDNIIREKDLINLSKLPLLQMKPQDVLQQATEAKTITYGKPVCIAVESGCILIGTNIGVLYRLDLRETKKEGVTSPPIVLLSGRKTYYAYSDEMYRPKAPNSITALAISTDNIAVAGFENGDVGFYDLTKPSKTKFFESRLGGCINLVQYISATLWATCDSSGNVFLHKFERGIFTHDLESQLLLNQQAPITSIAVLPPSFQESYFPESLKGQFTQASPPNKVNMILFALGSENHLWLVRIALDSHKKAQMLCDYDRRGGGACCIGWVRCKSLYLAVSWGKQLHMFRLCRSTPETLSFTLESTHVLQQPLLYIRSAHVNVTYMLTNGGRMLLMNQDTQIEMLRLPIAEGTTAKIMSFSYDHAQKLGYMLVNGEWIAVQELGFAELFRYLLEHHKNAEAQSLLVLGRTVDVSKEVLRESLVLLTYQLLKPVYTALQMKQFSEAAVEFGKVLEFVLPFEDESVLFEQMFESVAGILGDGGEFFNKQLSGHLRKVKITFIPHKYLESIVQYLLSNQELELISVLFESLDLTRVNQRWALQTCIDHSLLKPLILLCSVNNELMTPLFQMWNYRNECVRKRDLEGALMYGRKCLAYLLFTMQGRLLTGGVIPQQQYIHLIEMVTVWIFEIENLINLILLDPQGCFEMLYTLFRVTTVHLVEFSHRQNLDIIQKCIEPYLDDSHKKQFAVLQIFRSQRRVQSNNIIIEQSYDIQKYYSLFMLRLNFELRIQKLDFDSAIWLVFYISHNRAFLFEIDTLIFFKTAERSELDQICKHHHVHEILQFLHERLMLKLVEVCSALCDKSDEWQDTQLNQLSSMSVLSEFPLAQSYLCTQKRDYERAFNCILRASNTLIRFQIFKWLYSTFQELQLNKHNDDTNNFNLLGECVIKNLTDLIKMDLHHTRQLIAIQPTLFQDRVIEKLASLPIVQLEYIDFVVLSDRSKNIKITNQTLRKQIELLCQLQPHRVLLELQSSDYPLDEVLLICKHYGNAEAQAYIQERTGSILEALTIHLELLSDAMERCLKGMNEYEDIAQADMDAINAKSALVVEMCRRNSNHDCSVDNWYLVLDFFVEFLQKHLDRGNPQQEPLRKHLIQTLSFVFEEISMYTSIDIFATNLEERYGKLEMGELKYTFMRILSNFSYQQSFLLNIRGPLADSYRAEFVKMIRQRTVGQFVHAFCDQCWTPLNSSPNPIAFRCGHNLHYECNGNPRLERCHCCKESDFNIFDHALEKKKRMQQLTAYDQDNKRSRQSVASQNHYTLKEVDSNVPITVESKLQKYDRDRFKRLSNVLQLK